KALFALLVTASVVGLILALSPHDGDRGAASEGSPSTDAPPRVPRPPVAGGARAAGNSEAPRLAGQPITLAEAVAIAEKLGKGQAVKAERRDRPEVVFRIDLLDAAGAKSKVELNADGSARQHR
ncbi:MAG: PepSY domain-containing protein, partial [Planctomycetia bacterium]|nr:PepSY domain-containing protein [Planctomycetia bacterium]